MRLFAFCLSLLVLCSTNDSPFCTVVEYPEKEMDKVLSSFNLAEENIRGSIVSPDITFYSYSVKQPSIRQFYLISYSLKSSGAKKLFNYEQKAVSIVKRKLDGLEEARCFKNDQSALLFVEPARFYFNVHDDLVDYDLSELKDFCLSLLKVVGEDYENFEQIFTFENPEHGLMKKKSKFVELGDILDFYLSKYLAEAKRLSKEDTDAVNRVLDDLSTYYKSVTSSETKEISWNDFRVIIDALDYSKPATSDSVQTIFQVLMNVIAGNGKKN